jgi:hypothetical protein
MQTNSNRKGLALGAIFALLLSTFGLSAPAVAADAVEGAQIEIRVGAGADDDNFNGVIFEDFPVLTLLKPGVTNTQWADGNVYYEVTKVSGAMDVILSTYSTAIADGVDSVCPRTWNQRQRRHVRTIDFCGNLFAEFNCRQFSPG